MVLVYMFVKFVIFRDLFSIFYLIVNMQRIFDLSFLGNNSEWDNKNAITLCEVLFGFIRYFDKDLNKLRLNISIKILWQLWRTWNDKVF